MKKLIPIVAFLALAAAPVFADDAKPEWACSVSLWGYDVPESQDYLNPNFTADRGRLHLEVRYQYEAIDTTSVWAGANFHAGKSWSFDATAMLGGVFGDLDGVAPGYRLSLEHKWFYLASEGEYFISSHGDDGDYLYSWTEAGGYPVSWFRLGLAAQRTRAYQSDLSIQRGAYVGFTFKSFDAAAYVFNPWDDPTYVLALRLDF
ncbi:MAG TPA: hypothetical protein VFV19_00070 [Candidatus Polarisedimenticolaceae bacterium]|nr:hypothetical protein [Candidatus Polarisedimenticolaceae bacterium]